MKKYEDFEDIQSIDWTKYVIICESEKDRLELMEAFEHIHYSDINTNFITVNQLAHEYLDDTRVSGSSNNIHVNKEVYDNFKK